MTREAVSVFFGRNAEDGGRQITASPSNNRRSGEITVQVTINYFAQVRQAAGGVESERLSLDEGVDIQTALSELAGRHGDAFRALVLDQAGTWAGRLYRGGPTAQQAVKFYDPRAIGCRV